MVIKHTSLMFFEFIEWLGKKVLKTIRRKINERRGTF